MERANRFFVGRAIRLVDLADLQNVIADRTFEDCLILGPGVMVPSDATVFKDCGIEGPADSFVIELAESQNAIMGAMKVSNCVFKKCRFSRLGVTGPRAAIEMWRKGLN